VSTWRLRDVRVFRPYPDEVPWELLAQSGADEDTLAAVLELDLVRVAKYRGRVLGAYGIRPLTSIRFELVALAVAPSHRRRGLGRWLLGHAVGLAESRGAREVLVRGQRHQRLLGAIGFEPDGPDLLLGLTPE
jgi:GNAT superfamily N-acetyltransferase